MVSAPMRDGEGDENPGLGTPAGRGRGTIGQSRRRRKSARIFSLGPTSGAGRRETFMTPDHPTRDLTSPEGESDRSDFERFTRRLIGLARAQLDARLHHKIDPED